MNKIPPSRRMRQEIVELLFVWEVTAHSFNSYIRLGARYMLLVILERKVEEFLGNVHYQQRLRGKNGRRNGYEPTKVNIDEGVLEAEPAGSLAAFRRSLTPGERETYRGLR